MPEDRVLQVSWLLETSSSSYVFIPQASVILKAVTFNKITQINDPHVMTDFPKSGHIII